MLTEEQKKKIKSAVNKSMEELDSGLNEIYDSVYAALGDPEGDEIEKEIDDYATEQIKSNL